MSWLHSNRRVQEREQEDQTRSRSTRLGSPDTCALSLLLSSSPGMPVLEFAPPGIPPMSTIATTITSHRAPLSPTSSNSLNLNTDDAATVRDAHDSDHLSFMRDHSMTRSYTDENASIQRTRVSFSSVQSVDKSSAPQGSNQDDTNSADASHGIKQIQEDDIAMDVQSEEDDGTAVTTNFGTISLSTSAVSLATTAEEALESGDDDEHTGEPDDDARTPLHGT